MIGRSMVVRRTERIDVECIVRGYITGSGWADYKKAGAGPGQAAGGDGGGQVLHDPIFTPTTKADEGHDMPMTDKDVNEMAGATSRRIRDSRSRCTLWRGLRRARGIIIADTKFEFG